MARCDQCGNEYAKAFTVTMADGSRHVFDSFECAVQKLAPNCAHCRCKVIGHGVEENEVVYCCHHCATKAGEAALIGD